MRIKTNNKPRPIVYGWELTRKKAIWFDHYDYKELNEATFFWYKGWLYDLADFVITRGELKDMGWDGVMHETFSSGIVVKFCNNDYSRDNDIIVGLVTV